MKISSLLSFDTDEIRSTRDLRFAMTQMAKEMSEVIQTQVLGLEAKNAVKIDLVKVIVRQRLASVRGLAGTHFCGPWPVSNKVTLTIGTTSRLHDVIETLLHEVCHLYQRPGDRRDNATAHGASFRAILAPAAKALFGIDLPPEAVPYDPGDLYVYDKCLEELMARAWGREVKFDLRREWYADRLVDLGALGLDQKRAFLFAPMNPLPDNTFPYPVPGRPVGQPLFRS